MMNNPMMQMMQMVRNGLNPMTMMRNMARTDPQVAQFMKMIEGKNPQQLRQMAENVARERGVTLEEVARQLGIPMK